MIARKILPILLIVLVVLFAVYLVIKRNSINNVPNTKIENIATNKTTELFLNPTSISLKKGEEKQITISINSPTNEVTGVQLVLKYDQNIVSIKDIKPGDFMPEPSILLKDIESTEGQTNFALGTFKPKSGKGTVAIISLVGKNSGKSDFAIEESKIAVDKHGENDLKSATVNSISVR